MNVSLKVNKILSIKCERAYAVQFMKLFDKDFVICASEARPNEPGICVAYNVKDLTENYTIWDNVGGCMGFVKDPFDSNAFYAVQKFYLKEVPSKAKIVRVVFNGNSFVVNDFLQLPLVHRIGVLDKYLICCTVSKYKSDKDDWSNPGEIIAFDLTSQNKHARVIDSTIFRNHGFYQMNDAIYIGGDNGLYKLILNNDKFHLIKLLSEAIGDMCITDLNNDGIDELITINKMHGDEVSIYQFDGSTYYKVFTYGINTEFIHALTPGMINRDNYVFVGVRKGNGNTLAISYIDGTYHLDCLDKSAGAANLSFVNLNNQYFLGAANHTSGEFSLYKLEKNYKKEYE